MGMFTTIIDTRIAIRCIDCDKIHVPNVKCENINRGRRFFLLGALLAPVTTKIESVAPKYVYPPIIPLYFLGRIEGVVMITNPIIITELKIEDLEVTISSIHH